MLLSQLSPIAQLEIRRDAQFLSLGLLSHQLEKMLVVLYDPKYLDRLMANPQIGCVITSDFIASALPERLGVAVAPDPLAAFYQIHRYLMQQADFYWRDFEAKIASDAQIDPRAIVAKKNVCIGRGAIIEPNVVIYERSMIGDQAVIRTGVVIGGEGFEPKNVGSQKIIVPHAGGVRIGDRVEIQALSHVCKSVFGGFTRIGDDTKIDALVHIAHNVTIGCRCEIAAGAVIAGSSEIGDDVWVGPHATISSEISVGDRAFVALGAVVLKNVSAGARVLGNPARVIGG